MKTIGFIILRHVNSPQTDKYWKLAHSSVRKYYPDAHILIIDDNSNYAILDVKHESQLENTTVIRSEYHKRGELLPYYYYLSNKLFDIAVIIHDSVFINSDKLDFNTDTYKILWDFEHKHDQPEDERNMISLLDNNAELLEFHSDKTLWKGCFGCMTAISHDFLTEINAKYDLSKLLPYVVTRYNRMSLERVIGCILQKHAPHNCMLGPIKKYCRWGITFAEIPGYLKLPIIKVWTGR